VGKTVDEMELRHVLYYFNVLHCWHGLNMSILKISLICEALLHPLKC